MKFKTIKLSVEMEFVGEDIIEKKKDCTVVTHTDPQYPTMADLEKKISDYLGDEIQNKNRKLISHSLSIKEWTDIGTGNTSRYDGLLSLIYKEDE